MDKKWWTLLAVCAGTFMLLLDVTIVVIALPEIQRSLHASFAGVQWVVDAYALTLAALLLTSGALADRYGRRRLFAVGLSIFTVGSLLCGLAQSPAMLIASRCGQGVGGALMFATSLALLARTFHGSDRAVAFSAWGATTGAAVALGPILGGAITNGIGWRWIFLANIPVGVLALAVTLRKIQESRAPAVSRPDWTGFVLLTGGLVGLVYGLIRASETTWTDHRVLACLAAGAVLLTSFVIVEARVTHPMFDLSLFRTPTFVGGSIAAFTMNASLFAMFLYLVIYLQNDLGYSSLGAGLRLLIITGALLVTAAVSGRLSEHLPIRLLIGPGLALVGIGLFLMSGLHGDSSWTHLVPGFIVAGIGAGLVNPPLAATAIGVVTPERSGMASGVNSTFRQVGIATSVAVLASVLSSSLRRNLDHALTAIPSLHGRSAQIAASIRQGDTGTVLASVRPQQRAVLGTAIRNSFAASINDLLVVTGTVALVGAVCALTLIRTRDIIASESGEQLSQPQSPAELHPAAR
ncbi:MAG TPA: MFS transporter [Mycobacteriales bacterium]|jgi:EmrB/QacA subfamily drug resistance transporter|nr:MFS transporter [Mycobacteriales bacterium]